MNRYLNFVERLCEAYLKRRGRTVLPKYFAGLAIGNGTARLRKDGLWEVYVPENFIIAVNYSIVWKDSDALGNLSRICSICGASGTEKEFPKSAIGCARKGCRMGA